MNSWFLRSALEPSPRDVLRPDDFRNNLDLEQGNPVAGESLGKGR